jgi:hypothetical protein
LRNRDPVGDGETAGDQNESQSEESRNPHDHGLPDLPIPAVPVRLNAPDGLGSS